MRMVTSKDTYYDEQKAIGLAATLNEGDKDGWSYEADCLDEETDKWVIKVFDEEGNFVNLF